MPDQTSARAACEARYVIDLNPVPGSSQVWLDVDGVKVVVAFHEVEAVAQ